MCVIRNCSGKTELFLLAKYQTITYLTFSSIFISILPQDLVNQEVWMGLNDRKSDDNYVWLDTEHKVNISFLSLKQRFLDEAILCIPVIHYKCHH